MEIFINALIFVFAGYWFQQGIMVYKFWGKNQPSSGFVPVLFAIILMVLSAVLLIKEIIIRVKKPSIEKAETESDVDDGNKKLPSWILPLVPAAYTLLSIGAMVLLGVIPSMFLTAFIWLKFISKIPLLKSLLISVLLTLFVYLLFVLWLRIPFPRGIFGF